MMMIPVEIKSSPIHGHGIFATRRVPRETVLWQFTPGLDHLISDYALEYSEPRIRDFVRARGYINPENRTSWVIPGDEAQFWNFPPNGAQANCKMGGLQDGEHLVLAARDIEAGEELFIPPESDFDYDRKMG